MFTPPKLYKHTSRVSGKSHRSDSCKRLSTFWTSQGFVIGVIRATPVAAFLTLLCFDINLYLVNYRSRIFLLVCRRLDVYRESMYRSLGSQVILSTPSKWFPRAQVSPHIWKVLPSTEGFTLMWRQSYLAFQEAPVSHMCWSTDDKLYCKVMECIRDS